MHKWISIPCVFAERRRNWFVRTILGRKDSRDGKVVNILIDTTNIVSILPRPLTNSGLIWMANSIIMLDSGTTFNSTLSYDEVFKLVKEQ